MCFSSLCLNAYRSTSLDSRQQSSLDSGEMAAVLLRSITLSQNLLLRALYTTLTQRSGTKLKSSALPVVFIIPPSSSQLPKWELRMTIPEDFPYKVRSRSTLSTVQIPDLRRRSLSPAPANQTVSTTMRPR